MGLVGVRFGERAREGVQSSLRIITLDSAAAAAAAAAAARGSALVVMI
jgi:hypothetical protein